jgi:hypothetical protein
MIKKWDATEAGPMIWVPFTLKKTNKMGKGQPSYEGHENELGWKNDHPKDPSGGCQQRTK